jgi:hypothetical protein
MRLLDKWRTTRTPSTGTVFDCIDDLFRVVYSKWICACILGGMSGSKNNDD